MEEEERSRRRPMGTRKREAERCVASDAIERAFEFVEAFDFSLSTVSSIVLQFFHWGDGVRWLNVDPNKLHHFDPFNSLVDEMLKRNNSMT